MNLFKSNHLFFLLLLAHILVMESIAWFTIFYFGNGWIPTVITAFVLATSQVRRGALPGRLKPPPSLPPAHRGWGRVKAGAVKASLSPGPSWMVATRLWPPLCLQEVLVEPCRPQVHHRPLKGKYQQRWSSAHQLVVGTALADFAPGQVSSGVSAYDRTVTRQVRLEARLSCRAALGSGTWQILPSSDLSSPVSVLN